MTTVTICSSSKFYERARRLAAQLVERGVTTHTPRFDFDEEVREVTPEEKAMLTREFLDKVDAADVVYVIADGGYTGRSVCIEIGYATARGKEVLLSEPAAEAAVQALTTAVVPVADLPDLLARTVEARRDTARV